MVTMLITLIFGGCLLFAQQIEDWEVIFSGKSDNINTPNIFPYQVKLLDNNHFGFIDGKKSPSGTIAKSITLSKNNWQSQFKALEFIQQDSSWTIIQDWTYINDKIIYLLADSCILIGFDGLNVIYNYQTFIFKTIDGGINWQRIKINNSWRSRRSSVLSMQDSLNGILIEYPSTYAPEETTDLIWKTSDGWNTWSKIETHSQLKATTDGLFVSPSTIVLRTLSRSIFITTDLGSTWIKKDIPENLRSRSKIYFYNDSVYFLTSSKLISPTKGFRAIVAKSSDKADSWDVIYDTTGFGVDVVNLSILNDSTFYAHGSRLLYTSNNGKNWIKKSQAYIDNFERKISKIFEISKDNKLAVADYNILGFYGNYTLAPPIFIEPDSTYNNPLNFILKWNHVQGASQYHLQIVQREGVPFGSERPPASYDTTLFVNDSMITDTTFEISGGSLYKEYSCRIRAINDSQKSPWLSKAFTTTQATDVENKVEIEADINAYPNPAAEFTNISYFTNSPGSVRISLRDVLGRKVKSIFDGYKP